LATDTAIEVPEASREAGTEAFNWDEETKVIVVDSPFRRICDVDMKLLPSTVIVVGGDPTARVAGETEETVGAGFPTVKLTEFEAPPPGDGFVTTTANVPAVA
jgi:hypothetical protein